MGNSYILVILLTGNLNEMGVVRHLGADERRPTQIPHKSRNYLQKVGASIAAKILQLRNLLVLLKSDNWNMYHMNKC
jgi:hypothetical protein